MAHEIHATARVLHSESHEEHRTHIPGVTREAAMHIEVNQTTVNAARTTAVTHARALNPSAERARPTEECAQTGLAVIAASAQTLLHNFDGLRTVDSARVLLDNDHGRALGNALGLHGGSFVSQFLEAWIEVLAETS